MTATCTENAREDEDEDLFIFLTFQGFAKRKDVARIQELVEEIPGGSRTIDPPKTFQKNVYSEYSE